MALVKKAVTIWVMVTKYEDLPLTAAFICLRATHYLSCLPLFAQVPEIAMNFFTVLRNTVSESVICYL
jgi:hypothetical protein